MAITYINQASAEVPTTQDQFYLVPAEPTTNLLINGALKITNRTAGAISYSLWEAPSAGAGADSNNAATNYSIPANDFVIIPLDQVPANTSIRHVAASAGLTAHWHRGYLLS